MSAPNSRAVLLAILAVASLGASACRRTYVVVPRPATGYTPVDTLYGRSDGRDVRVTFHFDTTYRVDTVVRLDTLWRGGTRIIRRVDTLQVRRVDTVFVQTAHTTVSPRLPRAPRETPVPVPAPTPIPAPAPAPAPSGGARVDTVRIVVRDTIRILQRDTVLRRDTVRVAGRRMLFVPPGQYPLEGQCRIWIHDRAPGQQARATACSDLGPIPPGAFILFGGDAWDADYDWVLESQRADVPPEIVAVTRQRSGRP